MRSATVRAGPGQEARAHAIGDVAEPQIEARRLDLVGREVGGGQDAAGLRERRDHAVGQDALVGRRRTRAHDRSVRLGLDLARQRP